MRLFLKLVPFRNEAKMPAEVAICLGHSPESPLWKNYTQTMFDKIVPPVYQSPTSDRSRIQRTRSISTRKCATLQNQVFCEIIIERNNFYLYSDEMRESSSLSTEKILSFEVKLKYC